jgi:hypothetical protein
VTLPEAPYLGQVAAVLHRAPLAAAVAAAVEEQPAAGVAPALPQARELWRGQKIGLLRKAAQ